MAFSSIAQAVISVGKPTIQNLWQKVKDNFDDLDSRITTLEGGLAKIVIWNEDIQNAEAIDTNDILDHFEATFAFTLLTARIQIFDDSSLSDDLEIDVLKATDLSGTFSSVFSTKPLIDLDTASDYDSSEDHTAAVFTTTSVSSGDFLQLKATAIPGGIGKFRVVLIGELS